MITALENNEMKRQHLMCSHETAACHVQFVLPVLGHSESSQDIHTSHQHCLLKKYIPRNNVLS